MGVGVRVSLALLLDLDDVHAGHREADMVPGRGPVQGLVVEGDAWRRRGG